MPALQDLRDAIDHVTACTGDREAWKRGLRPEDLTAISAAVVDPDVVSGLLARIRTNHPTLFDGRTGAPITTPPAPAGQRGEAAAAIEMAEEALAQQNSSIAQLDLHVVAAILNARTVTGENSERLHRLQQQVEDAVRLRTDLDTPAGARDFQRFLIGKLREIGAVVESAQLDDTSKAALASAWTALYRTSPGTAAPPVEGTAGSSPTTTPAAPAASSPATPEVLAPYGSDVTDDELLAALQATGPVPGSTPAPPSAAAPPQPAPLTLPAGLPSLSMPAAAGPSWGGSPAGLPGSDLSGIADRSSRPLDDDLGYQPFPLDEPVLDEPADEGTALDGERDEAEPAPENTSVRLPDGQVVSAPNAAIAEALRAVLAGTPIVEAFRDEGIDVPPPGTAVPNPLARAHIVGGDIGMFTDRQAVAVDHDRAYFDGRVRPVADVVGPSFLGWLHPQAQPVTPAAQSPAPTPGAPPPQTRPATADAR